MQKQGWHEQSWKNIEPVYDLVIIGGGITGAGLFRMAVTSGLKTLLVDANDFSFGTSSRSSKMVHGGLRYIRNLQFKVTYESVKERERLLRDCPDLVTPLKFIFPIYQKYHVTPRQMDFSLGLYDLFGKKHAHGQLSNAELSRKIPLLNQKEHSFSYYYFDALVDDSRLVLRNIQEGIENGGTAINYVKAEDLLINRQGLVTGVLLKNEDPMDNNQVLEVSAKVVVNATGPWSDEVRSKINHRKIIRKLRGSHIQISQERFPVSCGFSLIHPMDGRSIFVLPWEGVTVVGTTDLDHSEVFEKRYSEPFMTNQEEEYLLLAANHFFPSAKFESKDIISSFSGLRPIISSDVANPSKASRAHIILEENGLITIAGGKLTIYHQMANEAMRKIDQRLNTLKGLRKESIDRNLSFESKNYPKIFFSRWQGRFGTQMENFLNSIHQEEDTIISGTHTSWAEIRWAASHENVLHLDDLLLRRVRLGLLLPNGGMQHVNRIKQIVQEEVRWDQKQWEEELTRYKDIITNYYSNGKNI